MVEGALAPWSQAWRAAASGPDGFYRSRDGRAEDHFVTPVTASGAVARRIVDMVTPHLQELAAAGLPLTVTDAGAGDGTLLAQLRARWPEHLAGSTQWRAIDLRDRPAGLDPGIAWITGEVGLIAAELTPSPGLLVVHELLDDLPCEIVEPDDDGDLRLVLVDPTTGMQSLGPSLADTVACAALGVDGPAIAAWCERWWPRRMPAARIEVGAARDEAWRALCRTVSAGAAIAVDYAHVLPDRMGGVWDGGTLTGHRAGRVVSAIPDGSRNLTAHVALDACAAAVPAAVTRLEPSADPDDYWWLEQWMHAT